jgi:putative transposase
MPFVKVWIHFVWSTKNREPFLTNEIRQQVLSHIQENAKEKHIYIDTINCYTDHVHCLISLGIKQNMADIMRLVKGESSFWINKNKLCAGRFEWQEEYFAVSVSESMVDRVRTYINNQEEHHRQKTFLEESEEFINKYDFQKFG